MTQVKLSRLVTKVSERETEFNVKHIYIFTKKGKLGFELERMNDYWRVYNYREADDVLNTIRNSDVGTFIKFWRKYYPVINFE